MNKKQDLVGRKFGEWVVITSAPTRFHIGGGRFTCWHCKCKCGTERAVAAGDLVKGDSVCCGAPCHRKIHGLAGTKQYIMWKTAKGRAKKEKIPFNLEPSDIEITATCPVLGITLLWNNKKQRNDNSPSLDKIIPTLGYVKGNTRTISWRANRIKSDATLVELEKITNYIRHNALSQSTFIHPEKF